MYTLDYCVAKNPDGTDGVLHWVDIHEPSDLRYGHLKYPNESIYYKRFKTYKELLDFVRELLINSLLDKANIFQCNIISIREFIKRSWKHGYVR